MKRKKAVSVIAVLLVALMLLSLLVSIIPTAAYAVSQSDIDQIQQQKDELSGRVQECQERIEQLKEQQANVLELKATLDEQNRAAIEQLQLVSDEIAYYDELIEEKSMELADAKEREQEQLQRYRARVRAMEENGGYNILSLILNSGSFSELLTAMDDMEEIMASDKALEAKYVAAREETEEVKADYEETRDEHREKLDELKLEQSALEQKIEEAFDELDSLEEEIELAVEEYKAAEAAEAAAAAEILGLIAQYNEQKKQEEQNNASSGGTTGGGSASGGSSGDSSGGSASGGGGGTLGGGNAQGTGSFVWPVPCSTRVTSRFGTRTDPIVGDTRFHSGIDIDGFGNEGNSIIAADGGTVITSTYNNGYGNYVVIDHGNSTQTVYAHMSATAVSSGDYVEQGQTIGYLGDSGRATGVHCHFEVIINGGYADPTAYFSGLTYWNC